MFPSFSKSPSLKLLLLFMLECQLTFPEPEKTLEAYVGNDLEFFSTALDAIQKVNHLLTVHSSDELPAAIQRMIEKWMPEITPAQEHYFVSIKPSHFLSENDRGEYEQSYNRICEGMLTPYG